MAGEKCKHYQIETRATTSFLPNHSQTEAGVMTQAGIEKSPRKKRLTALASKLSTWKLRM
ncbi:uncharacterized protein N7511_007636 [Penicillium nucicola]|uniref:uncharacterized protein n=1 Tax=Penicillium nucicola TaxID=1850975 RepID=UPI0025458A55|nr:uncharacterized protein N7511_007636 [Penicillium nucicola]KAJ5753483.1 hypothetical protein N7511_007636 [Penicillium nucicola]